MTRFLVPDAIPPLRFLDPPPIPFPTPPPSKAKNWCGYDLNQFFVCSKPKIWKIFACDWWHWSPTGSRRATSGGPLRGGLNAQNLWKIQKNHGQFVKNEISDPPFSNFCNTSPCNTVHNTPPPEGGTFLAPSSLFFLNVGGSSRSDGTQGGNVAGVRRGTSTVRERIRPD